LVKPIDPGADKNARPRRKRQPETMPLHAIEPRRLYRQVADQLRQLIDSGEFPVGERLPTERELAAQLGVSRPTVREALIALEVDGRVRIRVGSGIYVLAPQEQAMIAPPPLAGPFEILAARALFEGAIAEKAAQAALPADLERIDAALARMKGAADSATESIAADRAFHLAVARVLANDAISKVVGDLFDQRINPYFARLASYFESPSSWRAAFNEHGAIRDRIANADSAGARAAMQAHLERSQERFSRTFGDMPPPSRSDDARPMKAARTSPRKP
jgi:DNA-binding FadR family transcriptional regulator